MNTPILPSIQFFAGVPEQLSNLKLRRDRNTGTRNILMIFEALKSLEKFQSYTSQFNQGILLTDQEGKITLEPTSIKFIYGGDEGEDLRRVECKVEINQDEDWDRFMRFMQRYAEANGMTYQDSSQK